MRCSLGSLDKSVGLIVFLSLLIVPSQASGQDPCLARFVAPRYPPLARQAMIFGKVGLRLHVGTEGRVLEVREETSSHPLLLQEAKATVLQWEFRSGPRVQHVFVDFYFCFSGDIRQDNPTTTIKADFVGSMIRVFVTTDGVRATHP
jgi:hypothetical protein